MIDLTPVFQAVIALAVAVVTAFVIPWIKSKTTMQQREMLLSITSCLVYAAEQMYGAGHGDEKLAYVISQLENTGYGCGITHAAIHKSALKHAAIILNSILFVCHLITCVIQTKQMPFSIFLLGNAV